MSSRTPSSLHAIWKEIEDEDKRVEESREFLKEKSLLPFFERLPELYDMLAETSDFKDHFQQAYTGDRDTPLDLTLQLQFLLFQSAYKELIHGATLLLRGHSATLAVCIRKIIESVGIANLSKKDPEIAVLFFSDEEKAKNQLRDKTRFSSLFQKDDPIWGWFFHPWKATGRQAHPTKSALGTSWVSWIEIVDWESEHWALRQEIKMSDTGPNQPEHFLMWAYQLLFNGAATLYCFSEVLEVEDPDWSEEFLRLQRWIMSFKEEYPGSLFPA
jgi:hypothetical protein